MAFLKTLVQALLTTPGVLCAIYSFGVLVSFPSDRAKAVKLRLALQQANQKLIHDPNAIPTGEIGKEFRFKADIGQGMEGEEMEEEIQLSILEWRPVDLDNTYNFWGGRSIAGPPADYLLCYWRGEWFEILDSKTGKTSLDHQILFSDRIPSVVISAGLAWGCFRLRKSISQAG